jgi:hypothetical protein
MGTTLHRSDCSAVEPFRRGIARLSPVRNGSTARASILPLNDGSPPERRKVRSLRVVFDFNFFLDGGLLRDTFAVA